MDAKKAPAPGWETIRYMIAVVQYGGRITDEYDKLLMDTLAEKYFQQARSHMSTDLNTGTCALRSQSSLRLVAG